MKLAFSTVGCPYWDWPEILATAKDFGYDGVEVRGIGKQMDLPKAKELTGSGLASTLQSLDRLGLSVPCLASSCMVNTTDPEQGMALSAHIDLAKAMGTPYIRVLGDADPETGVGRDIIPTVIGNLQTYGRQAADKGVMLLLETNGLFADSGIMAEVMEACPGEGVGVLWDIHHPYRFMKEPVGLTWSRLSNRIRHIHVKDSRVIDGTVTYALVGQGDVPVAEAIRLLRDSSYTGWVSLEWVKRWRPDLEEPGLVFPHFIDQVRKMLK